MLVECTHCEAIVDAKSIGSYEYCDPEGSPGRYSFLKCLRCDSPFLVLQESIGTLRNDEYVWDDPLRIYPARDTRVNPLFPKPIRAAYTEALASFKAKAFTATAIMCRKTLEGICAEHGVKVTSLVGALKQLRDKGVIENRLYEWADALRISGNEAAHDVNVTIGAEDAKDIVDFTNALLEYVFTFRDRFEKFKQRRTAKKSP